MTQHSRRYQPIRKKQAPRFTVARAYFTLQQQGSTVFPKHLGGQEQLAWAFQKARETDRGHEAEYPESNDPFDGETIYRLVHENVRMWAEVWLKTHSTARTA